jgi:hypothetical protein
MKVKIISTILAVLLVTAGALAAEKPQNEFREQRKQQRQSHREQQHQENKAFRESLKDMDPEERLAAIKKHRAAQFEENQAFADSIYQQRRTNLEQRLAQSENLSESQKADIINEFEEMHQRTIAFSEQMHAENLEFLDNLNNMDEATRKEAIQSHRKTQREKRKAFRERNKSEFKTKMQSFRSQNQNNETAEN